MQRAQPAVKILGRQSSTYRGGWPQGFIGSTCSGDAPVKCQPYNSYNLNCCPNGQTCSSGWPVYCCPTKESCYTVVTNLPTCANSTWNMFELIRGSEPFYFCCPETMVGIIPSDGYTGICQENVANIPAELLATSASQFGNTLTTTTPRAPGGTTNNGSGGGGSGSSDPGTINTPNGGSDSNGNSNTPNSGSSGGSSTGNTPSSNGSSISPGAIAGIVIGSLIVLILGLGLVLWIHRQSLRRNPPGMAVPGYPPPPKPTGVVQVIPTGGDAPEVVGGYGTGIPIYGGVSQGGGLFEGDGITSRSGGGAESPPLGAAPAYSPPLEVSGVGRAEMEVPRGG